MQPNILLITVDQQRPFELGCHGHPEVRTPHVDRLAAGGYRFTTACSSNPVCTPARSTLVSGQYSRTCAGMMGNWGPPETVRTRLKDPTLPEILASHGYACAHLGKWHIAVHPRLVGFSNHPQPGSGDRSDPLYFPMGADWSRPDDFTGPTWEDGLISRFLAAPPAQPWFCFHNIHLPHAPWNAMPAGRLERYRRDQVTLRPNVWRDGRLAHDRTWYLKHHLEGIIRSEHDTLLSPDYDLTDYYRHYYAAVSSMDDQVGHALDRLDASGQAGRTIVMFTADHGDNLGSHHLFNKETMNEESIRIPWIVHGPGVAAGAVGDDGPVSLVDVPSTILGLAGAAVPAHFQGVDRSQQVRCGHAAGTGSVFIEGMQDDIAIRTATHKLAMRMQGGWNNRPARTISDDEIQFFDLRMDPYEQHNLAKGGEQRAVAENLKQRLRAWDAATPWMA